MHGDEKIPGLLRAGRFIQAEAACRALLQHRRTQAQWWAWLGESQRGRGRRQAAAACFARASVLDPRASWLEQAAAEAVGPLPSWLQGLLAVPRVSVAAALLVRDEAETIARAVAGLRPAVDRVVVADTGSRDETVALARRAGADLLTVPWSDDFAAARNAVLSALTEDWVLWVDGDEWLDPADVAVPRLVAGLFHSTMPPAVLRVVQVNHLGARQEPSFEVARMFPLHRGLRWKGRVHEQVVGPDPDDVLVWPMVRIRLHHAGYQPEVMARRRKLERNIRLLRLAAAEDPEDVGTLGFLGRELFFAGRLEEARPVLEQAERLAAGNRRYARLSEVRLLLAETLLRLGQPGEAWAVGERLVSDDPDYPPGWFVRGQIGLQLALAYVGAAGTAFARVGPAADAYQGQLGWDRELVGWKAELGLADVAKLEGRWAEAVRHYRAVAQTGTEPAGAARQLGALREAAEATLAALEGWPPG